jgi:hypothetical protein
MSNDDISGDLLEWVEEFLNKYKDKEGGLIFALCPDFVNLEKKTKEILELLKGLNLKIKFFVLDNNYRTKEHISDSEIKELKNYGDICLTDGTAEAQDRSQKLLQFIKKIL